MGGIKMQTENQINERIKHLTNLLWDDKTPEQKYAEIIKEIKILQKIVRKE